MGRMTTGRTEQNGAIDPGVHECENDHCADHHGPATPIRRESAKVGRNDPCPCGSGKKHKKCCLP
jgi:uncharacterized protein YecA (UPF0149 family)